MQDIVREARLSPGAIYLYFKSKEDIVEAIAVERHAQEVALLEQALEAKTFAPAVRGLIRGFLHALSDPAERDRRRVGVQLWAEALRDRRVLHVVCRGVDRPLMLLARLIRQAQRRREISRQIDPEAGARAIVALFQGFVLQAAWDPSADLRAYQDLMGQLLDGLGQGRRKPRPRSRGRRASR
jgi:AcrR family transcriptional regulator